MISAGKIRDGKTIIGLLWLQQFGPQGSGKRKSQAAPAPAQSIGLKPPRATRT
jgi:hypothetical protein